MHPDQVRAMLAVLKNTGSSHKLGVGVMMSYKTLHGLPTKWANAFPKNQDIADIFINSANVFNVLHYADYNNDSCGMDYAVGLSWCGANVHAIQFDMIWPDVGYLEYAVYRARNNRLPIDVILQVGTNAMDAVGNDPYKVAEKLSWYYHANCLDRVLLDKSMGKGQPMNAEILLPYIHEIKSHFHDLGIVIAGGLGPDTMHLIEPILAEFPDVSIDAQGRLRKSRDALDPIEWDRAAEYLKKAALIFEKK
jgi:hypothetical protein